MSQDGEGIGFYEGSEYYEEGMPAILGVRVKILGKQQSFNDFLSSYGAVRQEPMIIETMNGNVSFVRWFELMPDEFTPRAYSAVFGKMVITFTVSPLFESEKEFERILSSLHVLNY